jgi:hypothetical protein
MNRKKKKRKYKPNTSQLKYGVEVPRNIQHALQLDKDNDNGNNYWQDSIKSEMKDLFDLECFEIKPEGF